MGAELFYTKAEGGTAAEAFRNAQEEAWYTSGRGGYTGTIGEKRCFVMRELPAGASPYMAALAMLEEEENRDMCNEMDGIWSKWGPAGCFELPAGADGKRVWAFFGWASS